MTKNIIILMDDVHLEGRPEEMHLNFASQINERIESIKKDGNLPIVVCAGDIGEGINGVKWASQFKCDVIYVCGNHEFWGGDFYEVPKNIQEFVNQPENSHIKFLEKNTVEINGVRYIGATLWTTLGNYLPIYEKNYAIKFFSTMGDFKRTTAKDWYTEDNITKLNMFLSYHGVDQNKINELISQKSYNPLIELEDNNESTEYIIKELSTPFDGETVVISHHLPAYQLWAKKMNMNQESTSGFFVNNENFYIDSAKGNVPANKDILMMSFYANDLKDLMYGPIAPTYWFHGHLHQDIDEVLGKTKIISSPVGYMRQSNVMKHKEITLNNNYADIAQFVKREIDSFDWNLGLYNTLRELEKIIAKFDMCISMGIMSSLDFSEILKGFQRIHENNLKEFKKETTKWLKNFVYAVNPNIEDQEIDLFIIQKTINYRNVPFPETLTAAVNEYSFVSAEKYKIQNQSGLDYYHYREWLKEISKIIIQIGQYKKGLIDFCDEFQKRKP